MHFVFLLSSFPLYLRPTHTALLDFYNRAFMFFSFICEYILLRNYLSFTRYTMIKVLLLIKYNECYYPRAILSRYNNNRIIEGPSLAFRPTYNVRQEGFPASSIVSSVESSCSTSDCVIAASILSTEVRDILRC